ncbi:MAG: hypothetical protein ACK5ZC_16665 [Pirellulaceae bacterium]
MSVNNHEIWVAPIKSIAQIGLVAKRRVKGDWSPLDISQQKAQKVGGTNWGGELAKEVVELSAT